MWKVQGAPFLNYSKCIWDLNKFNNSHNRHGLKMVAYVISNGVERVTFWKSQTSPWGLRSAEWTPGCPLWLVRPRPLIYYSDWSSSQSHCTVRPFQIRYWVYVCPALFSGPLKMINPSASVKIFKLNWKKLAKDKLMFLRSVSLIWQR